MFHWRGDKALGDVPEDAPRRESDFLLDTGRGGNIIFEFRELSGGI